MKTTAEKSNKPCVSVICHDCPFRAGTPMRLRPGRVEEITRSVMVEGGGDPFICHKTLGGERKHCLGALGFSSRQGVTTRWMQLAYRLRAVDPEEVRAVEGQVFESVNAMQEFISE